MLSGGHFLASHDLTTEGSPALTELIDLEAQRRRIDHRQAVLLTEVAASGVCDIEHGHTTPMWLADRTQQSPHACRSRMNTAARLHRRYPQLAEALKTGRVGWQHVKVIDSAGNDRNWQDLADLLPGLDGGYDPASDPANNHLHLVPTTDGITYVSGQLVGELALTIKKLIDGETERVLKRYRADAEATGGETPVPSRAQACAEALGELVDRGSGVPEGSGKLPEPEIVVILNDTGDTEDGGELTDDDGNHLSPHILRFIIAAAMIRPLEVSGSGDPLRMGRTLRYANRHQRRALLARDGGCIFPGCDRPASWCDVHHVDEWDANGPTDIDNIGLLCRHHHRVTHRPGWTMTPTALPSDPNTTHSNGVRFRWRTPTGRLIDSQRHHQRSHPSAA